MHCSREARVGGGRGTPSAGGISFFNSAPLRPLSHAGLGHAMLNPARSKSCLAPLEMFHFLCRGASMPVTTSCSETRTPPCHSAESRDFFAAAFGSSRRFRDLLRFRTFGGCASGGRDGEYAEYPCRRSSQNLSSSILWATCRFVFGYRLGLGYPVGPTPSTRPRRSQRWRHRAAQGGGPRQSPNRPIADRRQGRRQRPEQMEVRLSRFGIGGSAAAESPPSAGSGAHRCTWPRTKAIPTRSPNCL